MNRTELVQAVVWLDQIAAHAIAEGAKLREQLTADARAEYEEQGTAPTWRIPDVATVAAAVSHESVYVADETAFTRWVMSRYPTEIETVSKVRTAWLADFLRTVTVEHGTIDGQVAFDTSSGEWVSGLAVREGGRFAGVSIRATSEAKAAFGAVANHALRQLAATAGPAVPVVLAELEAAGAGA